MRLYIREYLWVDYVFRKQTRYRFIAQNILWTNFKIIFSDLIVFFIITYGHFIMIWNTHVNLLKYHTIGQQKYLELRYYVCYVIVNISKTTYNENSMYNRIYAFIHFKHIYASYIYSNVGYILKYMSKRYTSNVACTLQKRIFMLAYNVYCRMETISVVFPISQCYITFYEIPTNWPL